MDSNDEREYNAEINGLNEEPLDDDLPPQSNRQATVIKKRKKQFRWTAEKDLIMVTEISSLKPFMVDMKQSGKLWEDVAKVVNDKFDGNVDRVGVQRRFELILKDFKMNDCKNRYKSGIEEQVTSIKEKLGDLSTLIDDNKVNQTNLYAQKQKKVDQEKVAGEEIRVAAVTGLKRKDEIEPAEADKKPKRLTDSALIEMWQGKQDAEKDHHNTEKELRLKELDIKQKELDLENQKFEHQKLKEEHEIELRRNQFELEKEERKLQLQTQKLMFEFLMKK